MVARLEAAPLSAIGMHSDTVIILQKRSLAGVSYPSWIKTARTALAKIEEVK
jgi:hypothetical protein